MSTLVVKVCKIKEVNPHSNADKLELAIVNGWQCVVSKNKYKADDLVVYFPPDTSLPETVTDEFGVTGYCQRTTDQGMRIRQARLRGEPSFGLIVDLPDNVDWKEGDTVDEHYGAKKYDPPVKGHGGDILGTNHILFDKFTDIQNLRNFIDVFEDGEDVVCTEKLHGTQVRLVQILDEVEGELLFAGSKQHPRKRPENDKEMESHLYWLPYTYQSVKDMFEGLKKDHKVIEIYGETYGRVQSLRYGINGLAFRCFALKLDGRYVDFDERVSICEKYGVPMVPVLYRGPYSLEKIKEVSEGNTTVADIDQIREGTVVQPVKERTHPSIGRCILKYVSDTYLMGKHAERDTTDA